MTSGYKQTMTCVACVEAAFGKEGLRDAVKPIRKKVKTEAEWLATVKRELAENEEDLNESEQSKRVENDGKDKPSSLETTPAQIEVPKPSGKPTEVTKQAEKQAGEPKRKRLHFLGRKNCPNERQRCVGTSHITFVKRKTLILFIEKPAKKPS